MPTFRAADGTDLVHDESGGGKTLDVTPPEDLPRRLGEVRAPVRVIAGAQDFTTGLAPVLAAARLFPNGEAVVIDDCGHYPWVEQPRAFREAADPFVR